MKKISTADAMTSTLHIPTQLAFTTKGSIENISSNKDIRYSSQFFNTKKFDTTVTAVTVSDSEFIERESKTKSFETKTSEFTAKNEKTEKINQSSLISYQVTIIPKQVIVRKTPPYIVLLASIPSAILVCLILPYLIIKSRNFIKIRRLRRRQSRIVRDSGMIEMSSVINEQYMPSPER